MSDYHEKKEKNFVLFTATIDPPVFDEYSALASNITVMGGITVFCLSYVSLLDNPMRFGDVHCHGGFESVF